MIALRVAPLLAVLATPSPGPAVSPTAPNPPAAQAVAAVEAGPALADVEGLARRYRDTGATPTLERDHVALVPFGHGHPVVRCAPLRACALELEAGELVLSTASGDSERWLVQMASTGSGGSTPLLIVKPTACDLSTNLLVATDRRLYEIGLDSPPCQEADHPEAEHAGGFNPALPYRALTRFYYPDELVRRWSESEAAAKRASEDRERGAMPLAVDQLTALHFTYTWNRDRHFPWTPAQVFDDGRHTVIVLPPEARFAEAPALFLLGEHGALTLLNYHAEHGTYVADRVLDHAVLLAGGDPSRPPARLEIVNHGRREH